MILIAGASGTVGSELVGYLRSLGHNVVTLTRNAQVDLDGVDVVINLAGSKIIAGRWTCAKKEEIYKSRIETTKKIVDAIKVAKRPPKLFISASATGYYGNTGDRQVAEDAPCGSGFLASVCKAWEHEAEQASQITRVITLRMGMVLTPKGGALKRMLPAFYLGLGATLGSGNQWLSWISMRDLLSCVNYCIQTPTLFGPINAVSPQPITNKEFTKALARAVHRPAWFRIPSSLLHIALGELADEAILSSIKATPSKLLASGFQFQDNTLHGAFSTMDL